jgi:tetratricopeptide (TPR) repeat protein
MPFILDARLRQLILVLAVWRSAVPDVSLLAQQAVDHIGLGVAAVQARDLRTGLAHFETALAKDSTNYEANWRAAIVLLDLGDQIPDSVKSSERDSLYARAELLAARAVRADSNAADGHFALAAAVGKAALHMGKKDRIRRARVIRDEALHAIAINPRHDGAYHVLGRWNAEIMRLSGLSRFFAKSFLGAGIFKQASWNEAIANMEKAVELDPGRIYHRLDLAQIYVDRKRYADARHQLDEIAALPDREIMDSVYRRQAADLAQAIEKKQ